MKTIIELGNEADLLTWGFVSLEYEVVSDLEAVERFAALVRADERERLTDAAMKAAEKAVDTAMALEREACAKVCDEYTGQDYDTVSDILAAAIRARGNT